MAIEIRVALDKTAQTHYNKTMEIKLIKQSDSPIGADALFSLSYSAAATSALPKEDKRRLLFSLYSMRCIFDNNDLLDPPALLVEYGCSFLFPMSLHPDFVASSAAFDSRDLGNPHKTINGESDCDKPEVSKPKINKSDADKNAEFFKAALMQKDAVSVAGMGVIIDFGGEKMLKFDAGSPLFKDFVARGLITGDKAVYPAKFGLFEAVDILLSLDNANAELKSLWLILFPYLLGRATDDGDFIPSIAERLNTEEVYRAATDSEYAAIIPPEPDVDFANDRFLAVWFAKYDAWRRENLTPRSADSRASRRYSMPPLASHDAQQNPHSGDNQGFDSAAAPSSKPPQRDATASRQPIGYSAQSSKQSSAIRAGQQNIPEEIQAALKIVEDAERLLRQNPRDEEVLLLLLASRAHLPPEYQSKETLLDSVQLISKYLPSSKNAAPLAYYMGLNLLGLKNIEKAVKAFRLCLEIKPDFRPATEMLLALNKTTGN